ncbi:MAG: ABC transporter ATP-binding protein [Ktedonobacteraceae bacterium]
MIEAQGLTRLFGNFVAVENVTFSVPDGAILALLGPNGAGKTTTVRMLAGLLAPTEGEANVAGYNIRRESDALRASVGLVTDAPGLFEQMRLFDYLDFFGKVYGMPVDKRTRQIEHLLEFFDLTAQRRKKLVGFSKGMKQKVALARALIHDPPVLFLDEPTSGLDPLAARSVRELINELKHSKRSIILCTHDLDEAERLADTVAIMRQGHIVACDTPTVLRAQATGETRVEIEFADATSVVLDELGKLANLRLPRWLIEGPNATQAPSKLEYYTAQPRSVNPQVLALLVKSDAQVVSMTCETRSLEDVYASAMGVDVPDASTPQPLLHTATAL